MKRVILFLIFISTFQCGFAQTAVVDDAVDERVFLLKDLEFFIDTTNTLTFAQASDQQFAEKFQKRESYQNKDYQAGASYWIRFSVQHNVSNKVWLIEFYDQTIDLIEAYVPNGSNTYDEHVMGDGYPFHKRKFAHKNFEVLLDPFLYLY